MSAQAFKAWLANQPTPIESASVTARRFDVHVSTVTSNLEKMGYVKTSQGWELPTKERPVTVTLNLEDVRQVLTELIQPSTPSIVKFTQEQKLKVLESGKTVNETYDLLKEAINKPPVVPSKILRLAVALHILSNPDWETY